MVIEFVSSAGNVGSPIAVVSRPSGMQGGDVMLALHVAASPETPAGWLEVATAPSIGSFYGLLYYKVIVNAESEPPSYSFRHAAGTNSWAIIAVYRGVDTSVIFDTPFAYYQDGAGTPVSLPSISTMTNGALFIVADTINTTVSSGHPQVTGMTTDATHNGRARAFLSEVRPTSGPTGTRTLTRSYGVACGGILTALRPANPPAPTARPWSRGYIVE